MNAIAVLKQRFAKVVFVRNNLTFPPDYYPDAPDLIESGAPCDTRVAMRRNAVWKLARFVGYCRALRHELRRGKYRLVILHDYLALLAFSLVRRAARFEGLVWFNSYDALDPASRDGRLSLMHWVRKRQQTLFSGIDFFSLPTEERKPYYPVQAVRRESFVIPNFPALSVYARFTHVREWRTQPEIRLIYQGALGRGHGFEQLIRLLHTRIAGKPLQLILKGWIEPDYKRELQALAASHGVTEQLRFADYGPYPKVPELASGCTIGLAIFTGQDVMNRTLGTASNKIYEYAAVGLPVLLLDTPYFRKHLGQRRWAFFTELSRDSLQNTILHILTQYEAASAAAIADFHREFNYESVFLPALRRVEAALVDL